MASSAMLGSTKAYRPMTLIDQLKEVLTFEWCTDPRARNHIARITGKATYIAMPINHKMIVRLFHHLENDFEGPFRKVDIAYAVTSFVIQFDRAHESDHRRSFYFIHNAMVNQEVKEGTFKGLDPVRCTFTKA